MDRHCLEQTSFADGIPFLPPQKTGPSVPEICVPTARVTSAEWSVGAKSWTVRPCTLRADREIGRQGCFGRPDSGEMHTVALRPFDAERNREPAFAVAE